MPTGIDIVVSEAGSRTVKRTIDEIGASAEKAAGQVDTLQAAFEKSRARSAQLETAVARTTSGSMALASAVGKAAGAAGAGAEALERLRTAGLRVGQVMEEENAALDAQREALSQTALAVGGAASQQAALAESAQGAAEAVAAVAEGAGEGESLVQVAEAAAAGGEALAGLSEAANEVGAAAAEAASGTEVLVGAAEEVQGAAGQGAAAVEGVGQAAMDLGGAQGFVAAFAEALLSAAQNAGVTGAALEALVGSAQGFGQELQAVLADPSALQGLEVAAESAADKVTVLQAALEAMEAVLVGPKLGASMEEIDVAAQEAGVQVETLAQKFGLSADQAERIRAALAEVKAQAPALVAGEAIPAMPAGAPPVPAGGSVVAPGTVDELREMQDELDAMLSLLPFTSEEIERANEAQARLAAASDQVTAATTKEAASVSILGRVLSALGLEKTKDGLRETGQAAEQAGHAAERGAKGPETLESRVRMMQREMAMGNRTVNFFARALNGIVPAGSVAGQALRTFAGAAIGAASGAIAASAAMELGMFAVSALTTHLKELEQHQIQSMQRAREWGVELALAGQKAASVWANFVAGMQESHLSDPARLLARELRQVAEETKKIETGLEADTAIMEKIPTRGYVGRAVQWALEAEAPGGSALVPTAENEAELGRERPESKEWLLKRLVGDTAVKQLGEKGHEAALLFVAKWSKAIEAAHWRLETEGLEEEAKRKAEKVIADARAGAAEAAKGGEVEAGYAEATVLWEKERELDFDRQIHEQQMRFQGEEARVAQENADKLKELDLDQKKYGAKFDEMRAATKLAGELNLDRVKRRNIEEEHAAERRLDMETATERQKIILQGEAQVDKLRDQRAIANKAKDAAEVARLDRLLGLQRLLTETQKQQFDLSRGIAQQAELRTMETTLANIGATAAQQQARAGLEAIKALEEQIAVAKGKQGEDAERELRHLQAKLGLQVQINAEQQREADRQRLRTLEPHRAARHEREQLEVDIKDEYNSGRMAEALGSEAAALEQYNRQMKIAAERTWEAEHPLEAIIRGLDRERAGLQSVGLQREVDEELLRQDQTLRKQGLELYDLEEDALGRTTLKLNERGVALRKQIAAAKEQLAVEREANAILEGLRVPKERAARTEKAVDLLGSKLTPEEAEYAKIRARVQAGGPYSAEEREAQSLQPFDNGQMQAFSDGFISQLGIMEEAARQWSLRVGQSFGEMWASFGDGAAHAMARSIVYGEDLGETLRNVARQAVAELLAGLIRVGMQMALNKALSGMFGTFGGGGGAGAVGTGGSFAPGAVMTREGGYTGDAGRDEVAGVVHGQEYVLNAEATRQFWPVLEQMNAGAPAEQVASGLAALSGEAQPGPRRARTVPWLAEGHVSRPLVGEAAEMAQPLAPTRKLVALSEGGYVGDAPRHEVAGVVHGQEFVVNAQATRQHRALLERLNGGAPITAARNAGLSGARVGGSGSFSGAEVLPSPRFSMASPTLVAPGSAPASLLDRSIGAEVRSAQPRGLVRPNPPAGAEALSAPRFEEPRRLLSLMSGGYGGDLPKQDVAGVFHGQEFVVNAEATKRNRATLEAMNAGGGRSGGATPAVNMNVKVENTVSDRAQVQVERTADDEVRIRVIARQEVERHAPRVVAADMRNPNGQTSLAVTKNTNAERRR